MKALTSKPQKTDPHIYLYNNSKNGGKSLCVNGKPTDPDCNVLANCVGWACGRFNHIYNLQTGFKGIKYPNFCCNAENFIEVAKKYGLAVGQEPRVGAIMCWQKGSTLAGSDGAGHVAIVEKIDSAIQVLTSESGYGAVQPMWNQIRRKGPEGRWGQGAAYTFRGFIYLPIELSDSLIDAVSDEKGTNTQGTIKKASEGAKSFLKGIAGFYTVTASALNVRSGAGTNKSVMVTIPKGTVVRNYGYYTEFSGVKWLYVQFTYKNVTYTGFCSAAYLTK